MCIFFMGSEQVYMGRVALKTDIFKMHNDWNLIMYECNRACSWVILRILPVLPCDHLMGFISMICGAVLWSGYIYKPHMSTYVVWCS